MPDHTHLIPCTFQRTHSFACEKFHAAQRGAGANLQFFLLLMTQTLTQTNKSSQTNWASHLLAPQWWGPCSPRCPASWRPGVDTETALWQRPRSLDSTRPAALSGVTGGEGRGGRGGRESGNGKRWDQHNKVQKCVCVEGVGGVI